MWVLQYFEERTGCPRCSHSRAEIQQIESDGSWHGRCPKCGVALFGTLFLTGEVQERIEPQSEKVRQRRQSA